MLFSIVGLRRPLQGLAVFDDAVDVVLLHVVEFFAVYLDFGAGPFSEQDEVARLHFRLYSFSVVIERAGTNGNDLAFLGLLLGGFGNDNAAGGFLFILDAADDHAVA